MDPNKQKPEKETGLSRKDVLTTLLFNGVDFLDIHQDFENSIPAGTYQPVLKGTEKT